MKYSITNKELFEEKVNDIELDLKKYQSCFTGDVVINDNCISGEHGSFDYEQNYGFVLVDFNNETI